MEFTELQAFVTVASERSFSRAAVRLFRTQPAVSLAIKRLEDDLGHQLFTRTSKAAELTPAGQVLLEYAGKLCSLRDEARLALSGLTAIRQSAVTLGANEALVGALLPAIEAQREADPDVQVDVRRLRAREVPVAVRLGELDFGVIGFRPEDPALEAVAIGSDEVVLLVTPSHRLAAARSVRLGDLQDETLIAHSAASWTRDRVQALYDAEGVRPRIGLVLPTIHSMKDAVERRLGITLMLRSAALAEISGGRLAAVHLDGPGLSRQIWLVFDRTRSRAPQAERFLDLMRRTSGCSGGVVAFGGGVPRRPRQSAVRARPTLAARS